MRLRIINSMPASRVNFDLEMGEVVLTQPVYASINIDIFIAFAKGKKHGNANILPIRYWIKWIKRR